MPKNKPLKLSLIGIFSLAMVFHVLVLTGVVPYRQVWGGRLKTREEMLAFESVSLLLNALFLAVLLAKANLLNVRLPRRFVNATLWVMVVLFALNTVGNLFAAQPLERYIATPITLALSVLCFVVVREGH